LTTTVLLLEQTGSSDIERRLQCDAEAHRLVCLDPLRRLEEQTRNRASRQQARSNQAVRELEQQRDTIARQQACSNPAVREQEQLLDRIAHQSARSDPQYRAQEQQINNTSRQQVSASRIPCLLALNYQPEHFDTTTNVGTLSVECVHCGALKFPGKLKH